MQEQLKKYFQDNPDATEVHVVLGYLCETKEDACKKLAGVLGQEVATFTRNQVCENVPEHYKSDKIKEDKTKEEQSKQIAQFKRLSIEKKKRGIAELELVITKKEASLSTEVDQGKAIQSITLLKGLLNEMQAVVNGDKQTLQLQKPV